MKILLAAIITISAPLALANKDWDKMPFDQQKKMKLEKLDKKSAMIQEARTCVDASKDKDGLKNCWKDMKEDKDEMKKNWKNKKKQAQEELDEIDE
jgi:hypothetical protein